MRKTLIIVTRLFMTLIFAALIPAVLISCGAPENPEAVKLEKILKSANPEERADAFRNIQGGLMDAEAQNAAGRLMQAAGRPRSVEGGLIREPIDFSASTIQYYSVNPSEIMESGSAGDLGSAPLEIVNYGPEGELPVENRRPNIYIMFNQPMVPLAALGQPITESALLSISPPVDGTYRWYGTKTLGFTPNHPLQDRPRYQVKVNAGTSSLSGRKLKDDFSFDVFGERVKIVNMFPGNDADAEVNLYDVPTGLARELTLEFNQPVNPDIISASIDVQDGKRNVAFTVSRPDYPPRLESRTDRAILLTLEAEPHENSILKVILNEGAVPFDGYPTTARSQSYQLRTIRPFTIDDFSAYSWGFPRDNRPSLYPIYLQFSHPLEEGLDTSGFTVTVNGERTAPADAAVSWSTIAFYLPDIRPGMDVEVQMPPGVRDFFGREAETGSISTTIPRPDPIVDFPSHYDGLRHLEAEFEPYLVWSSRNIVEGRLGMAGKDNFFDQRDFRPPMSEVDLSPAMDDTTYFHKEDLAPLLKKGRFGTVFFRHELRKDPSQTDERWQWDKGEVAVQVTDLGLSVRVGYNRVLVWVNRLSDGEAVAGAEVSVFNLQGIRYRGLTDDSGLAKIVLPDGEYARYFSSRSRDDADTLHVRAEKDGDLAEMKVQNSHGPWAFGVYNVVSPTDAEDVQDRIHMFTDRGLYKPGEEMALRGIHWLQGVDGFTGYTGSYNIRILEAESEKIIWSESGRTSDSGGFHHRLRLPEDLEPGSFMIVYEGRDFRQYTAFRIASFRRVNFQVTSSVPEQDYYHGDTVEVTVNAANLAGGVMPAAAYHYYWTRKPVRFTPPGIRWKDWVFGTSAWAAEQTLSSGDGNLSGAGSARISEGTINHEVTGKAYRYTLETTVEDIDRQQVAGVASAIVHPAAYYVAARLDQGGVDGWWSRFVSTGEDVTVQARLTDIGGRIAEAEGHLSVGLVKSEWKSADRQGLYGRISTRWEYVREELWRQEEELQDGSVELTLSVEDPGEYTLFFEYVDEAGRPARTELEFYATGSGWVQQARETPTDINLIVDKELYETGETARILVQSPVTEGRYLLSVERAGILDERIITLNGSSEIIEIPVREEYLPVFYVALTSFTERSETEDDYFEPDLGRPRDLFGLTTVRVSTRTVELDVEVESAQANYRPGDEAEIVVRVNRDGEPVANAEVTILAVDRGVLDLIDYHVPSPLDYFYDEYNFPHGVMGDDSRRLLLRPVTYEVANLQGGDGSKLEERRDFNPLALFEPSLRTGADGTVRVRAKLPDTLSTYRLTAMALEGVRLGIDENEFQVSNPVNVRTALPRRFRNRDTAAAGVILTNTTDTDIRMTVSVESDILSIAGEVTKDLILPGNSATELPFILEASRKGEGLIRFTINSEVLNEILEEPVTVEQPVVTEAFTTIGVISSGQIAGETLIIPPHSAEGFGGLSLAVDSTLYPYIEMSLNRLLDVPYPSLNDRLYSLSAQLAINGTTFGEEALFRELAVHQFDDGGIGYRSPNLGFTRPSWFLSILSAHSARIISAADGNFRNPLDTDALDAYLLKQLKEAAKKDAVSTLSAWTAWILAENGIAGPEDISWLYDSEDRLGIAGYSLVSQACTTLGLHREAEALYGRSRNFITIGTQSIDIADTYEKADYFSNSIVELALLLKTAAIQGNAEEFILKIAGSLDGRKNSRRFHSRFDDFWIVTGFLPLLNRERSSSPMNLKVDLEERNLIDAKSTADTGFSIREGFPVAAPPLSDFNKGTPLALSLETDSAENLFYAATLTYALPVETSLPRDEGIEIFSRIETLDGEILDEGELPLGETLRMRVSISTLKRRSFLKLVVPVPSGAEIVDPSFSTTGSYGDRGGTGGEEWTRETVYGDTEEFSSDGYVEFGPGAWSFWFNRPIQSVYDNAISYAWEDFYSGQREITFLIRTTTPGVYPTPPVAANLEFEPEVFGRGSGRLFVIRGE